MSKGERRRTRISSTIDKLPDDIKTELDVRLADTANTYEDLSAWLKAEGYSLDRIQRRIQAGQRAGDQMVRRPQPALVRPKGRPANLGRPGAAAYLARPKPRVEGMSAQAKLEEAVRWYQSLSAHLPHVQERGVVSGGGQAHWIQFSR